MLSAVLRTFILYADTNKNSELIVILFSNHFLFVISIDTDSVVNVSGRTSEFHTIIMSVVCNM
jgi:hypothetical protein